MFDREKKESFVSELVLADHVAEVSEPDKQLSY